MKKPILKIILFSIAAACVAYGFAHRQGTRDFSRQGRLTLSHLNYILSNKDDMALADWSRELEALEGVVGFRVTAGSKPLAEGGNQARVPLSRAEPGARFTFPNLWIFSGDAKGAWLVLAFHSSPGPPGWAAIAGLIALFSGLSAYLNRRLGDNLSSAPRKASSPTGPGPRAAVPGEAQYKDKSAFFLDHSRVLRWVSTEAALALKTPPSDLAGRHLLDLAPAPSLVSALEEGREGRVPGPFPAHPKLAASLKPVPEGFWVVLENL